MNLLQLLQQAKTDHGNSTLLDETALTTETDSKLTISSWIRWLNNSQQYHQGIVLEAAQDYFGTKETISYLSGTNEYSLKGDELRIRLIERTDTDPDRIIQPIIINDRLLATPKYEAWNIFRSQEYSYLWGNMIGFVAGEAGTADILYIRRLPDLSYGIVSGTPSTTEVILPATPTLGTTSTENDYYNGATIRIAGVKSKITDYVGSTRACTVAFTVAPAISAVYDIVCDIPEQHHEAICIYAAIKAKMSDNENVQQLQAHHRGLIERMVAGLTPRSSESPRYIRYISDEAYD